MDRLRPTQYTCANLLRNWLKQVANIFRALQTTKWSRYSIRNWTVIVKCASKYLGFEVNRTIRVRTQKAQVADLLTWVRFPPCSTTHKMPNSLEGGLPTIPFVCVFYAGVFNSCYIFPCSFAKQLAVRFSLGLREVAVRLIYVHR